MQKVSSVIIPGVCRVCRCEEFSPCRMKALAPGEHENEFVQVEVPCQWVDAGKTLCNNPRCVGLIPLPELLEIASV